MKTDNFVTLVTQMHRLFALSGHFDDTDLKLAIKLAEILRRWVSCEGHHGLKRYKAMSNLVTRHLMGVSCESIPLSSRYKRFISKVLLKCDLNDHYLVKMYWISIFSLTRVYLLKPVEDVSTITSGFKGSFYSIWKILTFKSLQTVKESFSIKQKWSAKWEWHISGASGPNGQLAYTHYLKDLKSLASSTLLIQGLVILLLSLPYSNKWETVRTLWSAYTDALRICKGREVNHSKLVFFGDKGGKTRVVALVDILSQSFLKTVHQRCNDILRSLPQDSTFDQDNARRWIQEMSRLIKPIASIDLTAATDRMPALLQAFVLCHLRVLSPLSALGWYIVSTRRDFVVYINKKPKYVRYAVGQPMGSLSSWPVMALTHHWLVRVSFALAFPTRNRWIKKAPYRVLGDDLSLIGFDVAKVYVRLISCFGMDYSPDKTYIKEGSAEFAKSLFCKGEELTPFPWSLLRFEHSTVVSNVLALLHECKRRKIPLTSSHLTGMYPKRWRKLVLLAALSPSAPKYSLDLQPREDFWVFTTFLYSERIAYFSKLTTLRDSISLFQAKDPGTSGRWRSPFLQVGLNNSANYPVRVLEDSKRLLDPKVYLGHGWISFCSRSWPDGLPPISSEKLIPGPTWQDEKDSKIFRSSLIRLNRLLPGYFNTRCVGKQVGD